MDIQRQGVARRKRIRMGIVIVLCLAGAGAVTVALSKLKPAAPTVEFATVWPDTVKRGPMLRQVSGLGTLVPEEVLWIPSAFDGRVEKVNALAGVSVKPETILLKLSNPDMELAATDLEWQVKAAQAKFDNLKVTLESQQLDQKAALAKTQSDYEQAKLNLERDQALFKLNLKAEMDVKISQATADQLGNRYQIDKERLQKLGDAIKAQLDEQRVQIEKLRAAWDLKKQQVQQLTVRAGTDGVLQQMAVEVGQRVTPGTVLAKIAQPWKLKAELKIAETQAKDILIGQKAEVDTRNGIIPAHVVRIDPAVVNGTVTVDCHLDGPLPQGARPDLSVDGVVEIERLADVVYMQRPVSGQPNSTISLFKIDPDGKGAERVTVKLGRSSVNTIEILDGLKVGDRVILSDMSNWDAQNRIRLSY